MKLILTFTLLFLSSCFFSEDGKIEINPLNSSFGTSNAQVSSVSIVNDQLVVNGSGLSGITKVQITGPSSFDHTFSIESKSDSNLIANGVSNIAFALDAIFSLTVTDANGSATYSVTFTLQDDAVTTSKILDGAVTAAKLSDMGAGTGQVLKYNGTTWVPGDLNALTYAGTWDASTATAPNVAPAAGEYYIVSVAAAGIDISDGSGSRNFVLGDWLVYNGTTTRWDKIDNASYVTSFNGRSGAVTPATNDYTWAQIDKSASVLSNINDVEAPAGDGSDTGKVLKWNNATSTWELGDDLSGGGAGSVTSTEIANGSITNDDVNAAAAIAYSKLNIADGDLTIAKTSGLQTALNSKLNLAGGTMTGDLTMGANNIITSGNVDGVDVSTLATSVSTNTSTIAGLDTDDITEATNQYFTNARAIAAPITGFTSGAGTVAATDTVLQAIQKLDGNVTALDTDDVTEATNLYHTTARARTAAVVNSTAGTETDQAASVSAMKTYVAAQVSGAGAVLADGSVAMTGNLDLGNNQLRLKSDNTNYVQMIAPNSLAATYTLTMPADDGTSGQVLSTNGTGTLSWISPASGSVTSVTGTAPIVSSGGTTPAISIAQANGSTDGFLDSADWTTFNNKQAAITTGTTAQYLRGDLSLSTFNTDVIGSAITGFTSGAGTVAATDTILQAVQKLDGNIAANTSTISGLDTDDITEATNQYFTNARAIAAPITGFTSGAGTVAATDTVLQAIQKLDGNIAAAGDILDGGNTTGSAVTIGTNDAQSLNLETNNSTAMTILSGGNVGIGTTSPSQLLDVKGIMSLEATNSTNSWVAYTHTDNTYRLNYNGAGNDELVIDSSGNVGIGTASPQAMLDVAANGTDALLLRNGDTSNGAQDDVQIAFGYAGGNTFKHWVTTRHNATPSDNSINFYTSDGTSGGSYPSNAVHGLSINGGRVGISTLSPTSNLELQGNLLASLSGTVSVTAGTAAVTGSGTAFHAELAVGDAIKIGTETFTVQAIGSATALTLDSNHVAGASGVTATIDPNLVSIKTGDASEVFTVNSEGKVGVGTTSPSKSLHVVSSDETALFEGSATWGSAIQIDATGTSGRNFQLQSTAAAAGEGAGKFLIVDKDASQTRLTVDSSGNVGIGTTTPSTKLEVNGTVTATAFAGDGSALTGISATGVAAGAGTVGAPSMSFSTDTNTGFYSSGADQIGVSANGASIFDFTATGLTSPTTGGSHMTTGNGTAAAPTFSFAGDTDTGWYRAAADTLAAATGGSERMRIDSSGNVGIGTTTPASKLHVSGGNMLLDNTYYLYGRDSGGTDEAILGVWSDDYTKLLSAGSGVDIQSDAGATLVRVLDAGNVGIGTTSPTGDLHISVAGGGGTGVNSALVVESTSSYAGASVISPANQNTYVELIEGTDKKGGIETFAGSDYTYLGGYNGHLLSLGASSTTAAEQSLNILAGGNVGIGTTTPGEKLDVTASLANIRLYNTHATTKGTLFQMIDTDWQAGIYQESGSLYMRTGGSTATQDRLMINATGTVGIGTTSPNDSALLDVSSTSKGFLPPRMTTSQRVAISTPAEGLIVFDTDLDALHVYQSSSWTKLSSATDVSFSVHKNGTNQTVTSSTWTKLTWSTEEIDSNGNFASDRFTPTVAGKYLIHGKVFCTGNTSWCHPAIYKNGALIKSGGSTETTSGAMVPVSIILDMNGTTDYVELYAYNNGGTTIRGDANYTFFFGYLISGGASGGSADDLGNHTATQNVQLGSNYISNDGGASEGLTFDTSGNATFTGTSFSGSGANLTNIPTAAIDNNAITVDKVDFASSNGINIPQVASAPGSPTTGQMYFNTSDSKLYIYNGSSWEEVGSGSGGFTLESWITPTFENSWVNYNTTNFTSAAYYKDPFGTVHLKGMVRDGTLPGCIFTLPTGYRPAERELVDAITDSNAQGRVDIMTSGCVYAAVGSNTWLSLDGISFRSSSGGSFSGNANPWAVNGSDINYTAGNVGIGTTTPGANLEVRSSDPRIRLSDTDAGATVVNEIVANSTTGKLSFRVDPNNAGASSYMDFQVDGSEAMRIVDSGNVGFGTTTPTDKLQIETSTTTVLGINTTGSGATDRAILAFDRAGVQQWDIGVNTDNGNSNKLFFRRTVGTNYAMTLDESGNLGVGTATPTDKVHLYGTSDNHLRVESSSATADVGIVLENGDGSVVSYLNDDSTFYMWNQIHGANLVLRTETSGGGVNTNQVFLASSGNVGIGTASPTALLSVNGTANKTGGGSWDTFSDRRLKTVHGKFERGLEEMMKLETIVYNYNDDNPLGLANEGDHIGFVAQEIEKVIPEAVSYTEDGYLKLNNDPIIWTVLNGSQEQQRIIEKNIRMMKVMQGEIADHARRIASLEEENAQIKEENREIKAENQEIKKQLDDIKSIVCSIKPEADICP